MRPKPTCWQHLIEEERARAADNSQMLKCTMPIRLLLEKFYPNRGATNGNFTAWSMRRVYFPAVDVDGVEFVASVPRNPSDEATVTIGV